MKKIFALLSVAVLVLAACSAKSPSAFALLPNSPGHPATLTATVNLAIPDPSPAAMSLAHPAYVSPNTNGLVVDVFSSLDTAHASRLSHSVFNVSSSSGLCVASNGSRTCTLGIPAPSGTDDLVITAYDTAPSGGAIPSGAQKLSFGVAANQNILAETSNTINVTLAGIAARINLSFGTSNLAALPAGTPGTVSVAVNAYDAASNLIVGNPISDVNGTPITINLSKSDVTRGGSGATSLSTASIPLGTGPVILSYNGGNMYSTTVGATASSGISIAPITVQIQPTSKLFSFNLANVVVSSIASGSDGSVWSVLNGASTSASWLGKINNDGTVQTIAMPAGNADPKQIAAGPDGNMWYTDWGDRGANNGQFLNANISRVTPSGVITQFSVPPFAGVGGTTVHPYPIGITAGPDGAMWFITNSVQTADNVTHNYLLGRVDTGTTVTNRIQYFFIQPLGQAGAICRGADGALWVSENRVGNSSGGIARLQTNGSYSSTATNATYTTCAPGPQNDLYFASLSAGSMVIVSSGGAITEKLAAHSTSSFATSGDGRVWFADSTNGGAPTFYAYDPSADAFSFVASYGDAGGAALQAVAASYDGTSVWAGTSVNIGGASLLRVFW